MLLLQGQTGRINLFHIINCRNLEIKLFFLIFLLHLPLLKAQAADLQLCCYCHSEFSSLSLNIEKKKGVIVARTKRKTQIILSFLQ